MESSGQEMKGWILASEQTEYYSFRLRTGKTVFPRVITESVDPMGGRYDKAGRCAGHL